MTAVCALACGRESAKPRDAVVVQRADAAPVDRVDFCGQSLAQTAEHVTCADQKVSDLTPLSAMTGLRTLAVRGASVQDLRPLAALHALEELDLAGNPVADLGPLHGLPSLLRVNLEGSRVANLSPLAGAWRLQTLELEGSPITSLEPLTTPTLRRIGAAHTALEAADVADLTGLEELDVTATAISDLAPALALPHLRVLHAAETRVTTVPTLEHAIVLEELDVSSTLVADPRGIAMAPMLRVLGASYTMLTGVSVLASITTLERLDLSYTLATTAEVEDLRVRLRATVKYTPWKGSAQMLEQVIKGPDAPEQP